MIKSLRKVINVHNPVILTLIGIYKVNGSVRFHDHALLCVFLFPVSNDFDVGLEPDISLADMYRWKVSAYAPCSSTCTTGKLISTILWYQYDNTYMQWILNTVLYIQYNAHRAVNTVSAYHQELPPATPFVSDMMVLRWMMDTATL